MYGGSGSGERMSALQIVRDGGWFCRDKLLVLLPIVLWLGFLLFREEERIEAEREGPQFVDCQFCEKH